jgi:regulator of sirC expression with transglutaminase-like and TPR domain
MARVDELNELDALVRLMDEPNEDIFVEIRNKVLSYGLKAIPLLEEAWTNTFGDNDSDRIESVIEEIRINELSSDLSKWVAESDKDIIYGLLIISRYFSPKIDEDYYYEQFEKLFRETWLEINDNLTALEKITVVNHVFYDVYQFVGNHEKSYSSDNYLLNKVFDHKIGNALSLGILYIAITQKLNIPIFGVNLPENFVLVYMDDSFNNNLSTKFSRDDILFYINPANRGAIFTHNEVKHYLKQMEIQNTPEYYLPCSNSEVIKRFISDLILSFENENKQSKTEPLLRLLNLFTK